ncbi:MAG TPA: BON domain-containing protein [Bacillota bacterium]|nr:BON domain-containing protein [Bacillota bacterium]
MGSEFNEELEEKLNRRLLKDPRLAPYALKARVYEDGLVQIQGIVDVLEEGYMAEEIVRKYPGVERVENGITVCTDGGIDDEDVAFEVGEELLDNPEVPDSVGVKVSGGQVQLVGSVRNQGEAQEAIETARKARGVREVRNQLKYTKEVDDATITNRIQSALLEEGDIVPGRIKTLTEDGVVTLWGNASEEEQQRAVEIAQNITGVRSVINHFESPIEVDDQIVTKAMERIAADPYLNEMPVSIEVEEGQITLSGSVDTIEAKNGIDEVIHEVIMDLKPAAFKVNNQVRLVDEIEEEEF